MSGGVLGRTRGDWPSGVVSVWGAWRGLKIMIGSYFEASDQILIGGYMLGDLARVIYTHKSATLLVRSIIYARTTVLRRAPPVL